MIRAFCERCRGMGVAKAVIGNTCPECHGRGYVPIEIELDTAINRLIIRHNTSSASIRSALMEYAERTGDRPNALTACAVALLVQSGITGVTAGAALANRRPWRVARDALTNASAELRIITAWRRTDDRSTSHRARSCDATR